MSFFLNVILLAFRSSIDRGWDNKCPNQAKRRHVRFDSQYDLFHYGKLEG
ncbi:hypothetical protein [Rubritalea tangerina]